MTRDISNDEVSARATLKFKGDSSVVGINELIFLAHVAKDAYGESTASSAAVEQNGYRLLEPGRPPTQSDGLRAATIDAAGLTIPDGEVGAAASSTQVDILLSDRGADTGGVAIVAFRGSQARVDDWTVDLNILPDEDRREVALHRGFEAALDAVWSELCERLDGCSFKHLWITGHSLGGALAVLTAYRLATDKAFTELAGKLRGVVSFGQPRVGDWHFASDYEQLRSPDDVMSLGLKTFRVVNKDDVVPRMPPPQLGFRHVGRILYVAADGLLAEIDGDDPRLLQRLSAGVQALMKGELAAIANHSMDEYLEALQDTRNQTFASLTLECLSARQVIWQEHKHIEAACPGATSDPDFPVGLALSGGGIRSATFNLGLLQALAKCRIGNADGARPSLLRQIDYLSTVSGGGYIGSWLSAWSLRSDHGLAGEYEPSSDGTPAFDDSGESPEITWLRRFSNYLTPKTGPFSADTLTGVATWLRNTLLNQALLISILAIAVLAIWGSVALEQGYIDWVSGQRTGSSGTAVWIFAACALLVVVLGGVLARVQARDAGVGKSGSGRISGVATALVALGVIGLFAALLPLGAEPFNLSTPRVIVLVPVFAMACLFIFTTIGAAVLSGTDGEQSREWLARANAFWIHFAIVWGVGATLALYASFAFAWLGSAYAALGGAVWFITTACGLLSAISSRTGEKGQSGWRQWPARVAPYLFILGAVCLVAWGVQAGIQGLYATDSTVVSPCPRQEHQSGWEPSHRVIDTDDEIMVEKRSFATQCDIGRHERNIVAVVRNIAAMNWLGILGVPIVLAFAMGRLVNINRFSFHFFYRNRLERCYLGASNRGRQPNRYTGLDPKDSPNLDELADSRVRPYHMINSCLNLTYKPDASEFLGWQERKGASFLFSPLYCGYRLAFGTRGVNAYQKTAEWGQGEMALGMAMTVSGAAANPNWGYHSNPATAFLLTLFNVRLGWWMQNPRKWNAWRGDEPQFCVGLLLNELMGRSSDDSRYVNLSDGGHFENLGIYELVRRRCKVIIASDAGADPGYAFEDLGNAVRKCRTDFGVDIEIDPRAIIPGPGGLSMHHCAVGIIRYPETPEEPASQGQILYIKSSLSGDESSDILQYKAQCPDFPQQSTADQWFDESQFESYRKLGEHIGEIVLCAEAQRSARSVPIGDRTGVPRDMFVDLLDRLWRRWHRPSPNVAMAMSRHGESLDRLFAALRDTPALEPLDREFNADWGLAVAARYREKPRPVSRDEMYFCASIFQLMEDVYLDLNLEADYRHPDVQGWMNLFKQWARSDRLRLAWAVFGQTYGNRFRDFCERRLEFPVPKPILSKDVLQSAPAWLLPSDAAKFEEQRKSWPSDAIVEIRAFEVAIAETKLDFGYAAVQRHREGSVERVNYTLLEFWIRPHLRGMGLGRRAALALLPDYPGLRFRPGIGGDAGRPLRDVLRSANIYPSTT